MHIHILGICGTFMGGIALLAWYLLVMQRIARAALEVSSIAGMAVALTYVVAGSELVEQMPGVGH